MKVLHVKDEDIPSLCANVKVAAELRETALGNRFTTVYVYKLCRVVCVWVSGWVCVCACVHDVCCVGACTAEGNVM